MTNNLYKNYSRVGQNIQRALDKRDMTQRELADHPKINVHFTHVNKWVKNRAQPSMKYLEQIAEVLDFTADELITGNFKDEMRVVKKSDKEGRKLSPVDNIEYNGIMELVDLLAETTDRDEMAQVRQKISHRVKDILLK